VKSTRPVESLSLNHPAILPIPGSLCGSQTHWTKVQYTAAGSTDKVVLDYVIRQFERIFGRAEEACGAGSSLRHRLARSPDPTDWSPESAEVRPLFKAPREDGSWFRAELDCSYAVQQSSLNYQNNKYENFENFARRFPYLVGEMQFQTTREHRTAQKTKL
jgi:hypothetical protein